MLCLAGCRDVGCCAWLGVGLASYNKEKEGSIVGKCTREQSPATGCWVFGKIVGMEDVWE